jgi:pilus assembly protein Flp/PilA
MFHYELFVAQLGQPVDEHRHLARERSRGGACILPNALMPHLLCWRTASSGRFYAVELTAPQLSHPRVTHGHGAENAGETKYQFDQTRVHRSYLMQNLVSRFVKDESGATAIEYGLIAAGIAIAIITAVQGVGGQLTTNFNTIKTKLTPTPPA